MTEPPETEQEPHLEIPEPPEDEPSTPATFPVEIPGAPPWFQELFNRLDQRDQERQRYYLEKSRMLGQLMRELTRVTRSLDTNVQISTFEGRGQAKRITEIDTRLQRFEERLAELERKVESLHGRPTDPSPTPQAA